MIVSAYASPRFEAGKRYHIVCQQFTQGCVTNGTYTGMNTPVYYLTSATTSNETWWLIEKYGSEAFTIKNAQTGQYITYDGVRQDTPQLLRYVNLTEQTDGDKSAWIINQQSNGIYTLRNVYQNDHIWDVRVDSYCVGTYSNSGNGNLNQQFYFVDEQGNRVPEKSANETDNGFDVSSWIDATTASTSGWQFEGIAWSDPGFGEYINDKASVVTPFLERWNDTNNGPLPNGRMFQQLKNLPANSYTVEADIIAVRQQSGGWWGQSEERGHDVWLYANQQRTEAGSMNEQPEKYDVETNVGSDGTLTFGVSIEQTNANWVAVDNFVLLFHGTYEELIEGEKEKVRRELQEYYTANEIDALIAKAGNDFEALEALRKQPVSDPLTRYFDHFAIDGRAPVYVGSLDLYLCTMPLANFGSDYEAHIDYTPKNAANASVAIDAKAAEAGSNYKFSAISGGKEYMLSINMPDGTSISKPLTFTSLPIVKMYGDFNYNYLPGSISVSEPDKGQPEMLNMKAKWRGGITNGSDKHKRNYHVKLLDEAGEKLEQKFFGLRNDNSWILESCQVDMSRIRNRMLTDLWNDFSVRPYYAAQEPKALTGSRGRFVELILNDEYRGIYCMTENVDRKQMKLKKYDEETGTVHGQLWKSKDWTYATLMGTRPDGGYYPKDYLTTPNEYSDMWDQYNVKYPDIEDVSPTDWQMLYDAVDMVCHSTNDNFKRYVADYFDLPLVIDYYILMETILATDNHGKNMFFGIYDKKKSRKITFAVWDMDATSGQRWSDQYYHWNGMQPEQDYASYIATQEHGDYNLFRRLRDTNAGDFNMKVRTRYRDLRQTYLATESILNRFRTQLDEFNTCGAAQREYNRWNGDKDINYLNLNFDTEMEYLTDWFTRRMNYLDNVRFDIGSLPSDIAEQPQQTVNNYDVFNLSGLKVGTAATLQQLPAGVYVINGHKIVKK